jgi:PTH2 family peptidyl-tRNA hydrolase
MEEQLVKQVIVIRKDLKIRCGKWCAQVAHASMSFLTKNRDQYDSINPTAIQVEWMNDHFTKICLQVDSLEDLQQVANNAELAEIECHVITDKGATEFYGVPTVTCLALGPDYSDKIDAITGNLKLY